MAAQMTLHWSPRSHYVRKVMIAAHEVGLQDRLRTVVSGATPNRSLMLINPLGKIPTLELSDGMLDAARPWMDERRRPAEKQSQPHMVLWREKLMAGVAVLEHEADELAEGPATIGHLAIGVALGYLDFRLDELRWRDGRPRLTAWHATFNQRPSVLANPIIDDR
jgi:glutathione S-transferase